MKVVLAIDSFKGCLSSAEANAAAAQGVGRRWPEATVVKVPVTDGGDGMLNAFTDALHATQVAVYVHDALLRRVEAHYALIGDGTALIESAEACGIARLRPDELNPMRATSWGVGELLADALERGCHHIILGLGGSATSDCGIGMLHALIRRLPRRHYASDGSFHPKRFEDVRVPPCRIDILSDVRNPLCGPDGAAAVFGPQKGATPAMVEQLDRRAQTFARMSAAHLGRDCSREPGAGAAGGLGYALMEYLGAAMHPGGAYYLDLVRFDECLRGADLVITGEGSADAQTLMGKIPAAVMRRARAQGVPTALIAGRVQDADQLRQAGFASVCCVNEGLPTGADPMEKPVATRHIADTVARLLQWAPPTPRP